MAPKVEQRNLRIPGVEINPNSCQVTFYKSKIFLHKNSGQAFKVTKTFTKRSWLANIQLSSLT